MADRTPDTYGEKWAVYVPGTQVAFPGDKFDGDLIGDLTLVVAQSAQEAKDHFEELYLAVKGIKPKDCTWGALKGGVVLDQYADGCLLKEVYQSPDIDWSRIDDKPWLLNDPDDAINDYVWDIEDEGAIDYRVGIQRDCICANEEPPKVHKGEEVPVCPVCGGEGTVTRWVEVAAISGDTIKLSSGSLEDAFADLEAFAVLKEKGYNVTRELS